MIKFLDLKRVTERHGAEIEDAVTKVVRSGRYLQGEEVERFEQEYAAYIGTKHAIGCGNGLDALTLILRAMIELGRLQPGDKILVPAHTFIATYLAISETGLTPIGVEPSLDTLEINTDLIEKMITPEVKGLMTVHLYGRCSYDKKMEESCQRHGLLLFEDNAQAQGCRYGDRLTGSLGLAAGHSFYPGKNLGALGDAGAVTTDDDQLAEAIRQIANYGSSRKYVFKYRGRNSRLDEIQAAILRVKLRYLDEENERRRRIARIYLDEIENNRVILPKIENWDSHVFHIFPILSEKRDEMQKFLADNGVETLIHYPIAPHCQECYEDSELAKTKMPITEMIHARELSLPISPVMEEEDARRVAEIINRWQPDK